VCSSPIDGSIGPADRVHPLQGDFIEDGEERGFQEVGRGVVWSGEERE